jgi:hypothetical protein
MNYCSIQEAWGNNNYISNQFKINNTESQKKTIESFSDDNIIPDKHIETYMTCSDFLNHLNTCKKCNMKVREQFQSKLLENCNSLIQNNKDIIVLILVGLCIVLFLNLIYTIPK